MDLTPNEDQLALQGATADWCSDNMPLEQCRARPAGTWRQMGEMGWLDMTGPAMGLDHGTEALIFAELGRFLAPVAALSTAVYRRWTGTEGKAALAIASLQAVRVADPDGASVALGVADGRALLYGLPDALDAAPGLDLSSPLALLPGAAAPQPVQDGRAAAHLRLLAAAYAVGCADAARDMGAAYACTREQFDRPIGWFQSIKHICADMAVRASVARSQLYYAASALDADDASADMHIAAAKRLADQAALENSRANIQIHGGIGMTDEAYPHLCLKRAHLLGFVAKAGREALLQ
ncbi:acyl-CoA dehydrogenase [Sphingobium sp. Sx8-8]|uniref:acyl-CoA dehydrogenase n=1 Tax=Sphingobium sp. Sx8-8 TaxID=2933617 RepID=UPI001F5A6288|nr:acyl-CoA dehydrogenase [Sphingobium sp. Sx8-8]